MYSSEYQESLHDRKSNDRKATTEKQQQKKQQQSGPTNSTLWGILAIPTDDTSRPVHRGHHLGPPNGFPDAARNPGDSWHHKVDAPSRSS